MIDIGLATSGCGIRLYCSTYTEVPDSTATGDALAILIECWDAEKSTTSATLVGRNISVTELKLRGPVRALLKFFVAATKLNRNRQMKISLNPLRGCRSVVEEGVTSPRDCGPAYPIMSTQMCVVKAKRGLNGRRRGLAIWHTQRSWSSISYLMERTVIDRADGCEGIIIESQFAQNKGLT